jgi:hypothetical protein
MRRLSLCVLAVAAACSAPEHQNPYDPSTPVALQAKATLAGTVSLEPPGATAPPLGGIAVSVQGLPSVTTDATGAWRLEGVPAGTYAIRFSNGATWEDATVTGISVALDDGGKTVTVPSVRLRVARGSLSGTFLLAGAASSAGVVVTLQGTGFATVTNTAGSFTFSEVPVGTYVVVAEKPDWTGTSIPGQAVILGADTVATPTPVTLQPVASASVGGTVLLEGGAAGTGTTVSLAGTDFRGVSVSQSMPAGTGGVFAFDHLVAGAYQVSFTRTSFDSPPPVGVSVVTGQAASVGTVTLPVSRCTIAGSVILSSANVAGLFALGGDRSGVVVTLSGTEVPVPPAVTDAAGAYRFTDVPVSLAGTDFTVQAARPSFVAAAAWPTVTGAANATQTVPAITLQVSTGSLSGSAVLWDAVGGVTAANDPSAGIAVAITGTAFNGTAYSTAAAGGTDRYGAWTATGLPPGTYDVLATTPNRACGSYAPAVLPAGGTVTVTPSIRCVDTVAPGALALGTPQAGPGGALDGYTRVASVTVDVASPAFDATSPTSNLRGYQVAVGPVPDWSTATTITGHPTQLVFALPTAAGVPVDGSYLLSARAIDWVGNTGPAATATVVVDHVAPDAPAISTSRNFVNATSASVTLSGSDSDPTFRQYEACTGVSATPATACAATPSCISPASPTQTVPSYAVQLSANQRNCIWARAVDKAGNASDYTVAEIVSDLQPPAGPVIAPIYEPSVFSVQASYVDFAVVSSATDGPVGGGPWHGVAWVEVDTGGGFTPICPQDACHPNGIYDPCSVDCGCADPRLRCDSTGFAAIRVPLLSGAAGHVGVRAVDVAGNYGSGASQDIPTAGVLELLAGSANSEGVPRVRGSTLVYDYADASGDHAMLVDLGLNQRFDPGSDPTCIIGGAYYAAAVYQPLGSTALVHADAGQIKIRRRGAGGVWCTGDTTGVIRNVPGGWTVMAVGAGYDPTGALERAIWSEHSYATGQNVVWVAEPGFDGRLATTDDPGPVAIATLATGYTQAVQLGGNWALYRTNTGGGGWDDGTTVVVNRGTSGFTGAGVTSWSPNAMTAALSADGSQLAWIDPTSVTTQSVHVRTPGANGRYEAAGDDADVSRALLGPDVYQGALALDGGHVLFLEQGTAAGGASYADHWYAGPNGTFEAAGAGVDDVFERIAPSNNFRADPTIGTGLAGGVVHFGSRVMNDSDLQALDLSQLRWETITDANAARPTANHSGTVLYSRATGGTTARAPDGTETRSGVGHGYWIASDLVDVAFDDTSGRGLYWEAADANGRFFTGQTPTLLTQRFKQGYFAYPISVAVGEGRVAFTAKEADNTTDSIYVAEPNPTLATPLLTRLDGAPANTAVFSQTTVGASARHAVHSCYSSTLVLDGICVRERGGGGTFVGGSTFLLQKPGAPSPYSTSGEVRLRGDRLAFRRGDGVLVVVDAGPDHVFNTADDAERILWTVPYGPENWDLAGNFVAYLAAGAPAGLQVWLADLAAGTRRQITSHYSAKQHLTVEPSGRVLWDDAVFPTRAVFVSAP